MFARFSIARFGCSTWLVVFEKRKPGNPKCASPTRKIAICTNSDIAVRVAKDLNRRHQFSPALDEDSGAWRLEAATDYEVDWEQVFHLNQLPNSPVVAIYRLAAQDETIIFTFNCDDADFITASLNFGCEKRQVSDRYGWRQLGS